MAVNGNKFTLGTVTLEIFANDIAKSLTAVTKLDPAQIKALAVASNLPVDPFDKKLLLPVLMGIVQNEIILARDGKVPANLTEKQQIRVDRYLQDVKALADKDAVQDFVTTRKTKAAAAEKAPRVSNLYRLTEVGLKEWKGDGTEAHPGFFGQKYSICATLVELGAGVGGKGVSVATIADKIKVFEGIPTPSKINVGFHINAFSKEEVGVVEQVDEQGNVKAPEQTAPKATKPPVVPKTPPAKAPAHPAHNKKK